MFNDKKPRHTQLFAPKLVSRFKVLTLLPAQVMLLTLIVPAQALAMTTSEAASSLAQGCFAIQAGNGQYLSRARGLIGNELLFKFRSVSVVEAEHFFVKPASLTEMMLTDRSGDYLASLVPAVETPVPTPSLAVEWQITAKELSSNNFQF
nr:hypothetical protein [Agitococcus sp.]